MSGTSIPNSFDIAVHKMMEVVEKYVKENSVYQPPAEPKTQSAADDSLETDGDFSIVNSARALAINMELKRSKLKYGQTLIAAVTGPNGILCANKMLPTEEWCNEKLDRIGQVFGITKSREEGVLEWHGETSKEFDAGIEFVQHVLSLMFEGQVFQVGRRIKSGETVMQLVQSLRYEAGISHHQGLVGLPLAVSFVKFLIGTKIDILISTAQVAKLGYTEEVPEIVRRSLTKSIKSTLEGVKPFIDEDRSLNELLTLVGNLLSDIRKCNDALWYSRPIVSRGAATVLAAVVTPAISWLPLYSSMPTLVNPPEIPFMQRFRLGIEQIEQEALALKRSRDEAKLVHAFEACLPKQGGPEV